MLCKHEVVGSIPSCSTRVLLQSGLSRPAGADGPTRGPRPVRTQRFATGLAGWRFASPPSGARGVLFDIVKSECVRPIGRGRAPGGAWRADPRTDGSTPPRDCGPGADDGKRDRLPSRTGSEA